MYEWVFGEIQRKNILKFEFLEIEFGRKFHVTKSF